MALEPSYATARAQLAHAFALLGFWGHMPLLEAHTRAKALALEATRLDEGLSQAHGALAWTLWLLDWDLAGCRREVERALALNPGNEEALILRAMLNGRAAGRRVRCR